MCHAQCDMCAAFRSRRSWRSRTSTRGRSTTSHCGFISMVIYTTGARADGHCVIPNEGPMIHRVSAQVRTQCFFLLRAREHHEARWAYTSVLGAACSPSAVAWNERFHVPGLCGIIDAMAFSAQQQCLAVQVRSDLTPCGPTSILIGPPSSLMH